MCRPGALQQDTALVTYPQILALLAWIFALVYVAFLLSLLAAAALSRHSIDPNEWYVAKRPAEVIDNTYKALT
jgi:hypothetical protein